MKFFKGNHFPYLLGVAFFLSCCNAESAKKLRKRKKYTNYHGFLTSRMTARYELVGDDDIIANIQVEEISNSSGAISDLDVTPINNEDISKRVNETSTNDKNEIKKYPAESQQNNINEKIIPTDALDDKTTQVNVDKNVTEIDTNKMNDSPTDRHEDKIDAENKDSESKENPIEYEDIDDIAVINEEKSNKSDHDSTKEETLKDDESKSLEISNFGDDENKNNDEGSLSKNNETEVGAVVTSSDEKEKKNATKKGENISEDEMDDVTNDESMDKENKPTSTEESMSKSNETLITTSWHEQIDIPYVEKDSLQYDFILGCILAATFTSVVLMAGCLLTQFCDCDLCCFESQNPHHWNQKLRTRKRFRLGESQSFLSFLKSSRYKAYDLIGSQEKRGLMASAQSVDSWASEDDTTPVDVHDDEYYDQDDPNADIDRLEYGESVESDYDDEVDYNLINHRKGRYDEEEIEEAAKQYFDEDRVNKFFTGTHAVDSSDSESDSDASDPPLDMEMIQKKTFMSIKNAKAATRKLDGKSD